MEDGDKKGFVSAVLAPDRSQTDFPPEIYVVPLTKRPFFPGMAVPILIEAGPYYETLKIVARSESHYMGLFLTRWENADLSRLTIEDLYTVGVLVRILRILPMEQRSAQVIVSIEKRITIEAALPDPQHLRARVRYHEDLPPAKLTQELKAYAVGIITTIKELLKLNPLFKEELQLFLGHSDFAEPGKLADFAVALTTASREEMQKILEAFSLRQRIDQALLLLKKELNLSRLQNRISQKIEATLSKAQREFFLREQLRTIKKELGITRGDKMGDIEKLQQRLRQRRVPHHVQEVIDEELEKLQALEMQSPEYGVCRNYLDWLTLIPWGIRSPQILSLKAAEKILEKDHYSLEDIKKKILEFISVGKLAKEGKGSIICLVGPPGVGKTSIGKSIARALNRQFYRFSVGGMRDEAEIKGHRRTYIGAMPGKIVQALKFTQVMNPVLMLDEVDKMGTSFHGDPASALLEVLDPEQNSEFLDHYLDVRCDLSNILFLLTANVLDTIPEPLKDRAEILRLSGYILEEKVEIARRHLVPRNRKNMGLRARDVLFTKKSLAFLVNAYAREAGVRSLERQIQSVLRRVALKVIRAQEEEETEKAEQAYTITHENLEEYLGKPLFSSDCFYDRTPIGVCMGLAWTALGGATLYVEAIQNQAEKTEMKLTGMAGDVMKESSQIAWTYLHSKVQQYSPRQGFFLHRQVHLHIPEGATPKDGPSAGITMATALLSLLRQEPVQQNLGMTGELTLTGKVLPIGGVREKLVAARRSGVKTLIFPADNRRDYDDLPAYLKRGVKVHFVKEYEEIIPVAFPSRR